MKHLLLAILILCALPCFADERAQGFCMVGGQKSITQGLQSTNDIMASYPQCQVNVYLSGTTTPASLFSDNGVTPLANPFTANTDASWAFYAADGHYDIVLSGGQAGGFPVPFTLSWVSLNSGGGGSSDTIEVNGVVVPPAVYNFVNGSGTVISNPSGGNIQIDSTGGGGVCGSNEIPCLNTPNTWTTGLQLFKSGAGNIIPAAFQGAAGGSSIPAYVQESHVNTGGGPFFGCQNILTGVATGDTLIAIAYTTHDGITPATAIDNTGDTFTEYGFIGSPGLGMTVLVAPNAHGGTTTITYDKLQEVSGCMTVEIANVALIGPVDAIAMAGASGSISSLTAGPITTTNPNDMLFSALVGGASANSSTTTYPAGYTQNYVPPPSGFDQVYAGSVNVSSTGTYSSAWSWTSTAANPNTFILALRSGASSSQAADLVQYRDPTGVVLSGVNGIGQPYLPSYVTGPLNIPGVPALVYNQSLNCPQFFNTGSSTWTSICGATPPGGSTGAIQVNSSGAFGAATSPQIVTALNATPSSTFSPSLLPLATASTFGAIKPDGVSCSVSAGVLACTGSGGGITTLTGDVTASGSGSVATTLATVNSGPGSCGDATHVCQVTTNGKGLVTAQSAVAITGLGTVPFSSVTTGTSAVALHVGTGGTLDATGTGTITATAMPYTGLTGPAPTWNQNTTGTSAGLTGAPAITVASVIANNLVIGNCLQASTGHIIVDTGVPCGSGSGGSGITALTGDVNASGTGSVPAVVKGINGVIMASLTTGLLKNTTSTGVPTIAVAGTDYLTPTGVGTGLTALNAGSLASGIVPAARLPSPTPTTLGGIQSQATFAHQWINGISTLGVPSVTQPAFSDISGVAATGQLPAGTSGAPGILQCGSGTTCSGGVISATGGGGIAGLTTGFLPKATSSTTIGNSLIDEGITTANTATVADSGGLNVAGTGASIIGFGGPGVTLTKAGAVTSATCVSSCLTARGSFTVVAGTATTGTLVTVSFNAPAPASVPVCGVSQSGGTSFIGLGHGTPTTSGFTVNSAVSAAGQTFTVDYWCAR